jgi:hypothetical protein
MNETIDIDIEINTDSSIDTDIQTSDGEIDTDIEISTGGTNDYNDLINKPSIEGVELVGDKTLEELGVEALTPQEIDELLRD